MASAQDTRLRLYNTLTRSKQDFVPLDPDNVRMYVCGPTVYDFAHIGNARPVIVFDVLFRLLRHVYGAEHVTYVRNITDVDDKINARAARDFPGLPLNEAIRKVTEKTAAQYQADTAALGALEPTVQPRATENIDEMQALIKALIERSHAYEAKGEVLFAVDSMPDYGQLSGRNLEDQLAGARVAVESHKRNPADFVLWKQSSSEEPGWQSPWGRGRPGWHIECSAMSERYLGRTFDIHGGGLDLIFPHHENEIAQSRCAHGSHAMANVWMHNGFVQVEGQKMSKSLGNFVTIHDLLDTEMFGGRKWPGEVLRLAMLMTHYREPIDFSLARLEEATQLLEKWERFAKGHTPAADIDPEALAALADDLDTPGAIRRLHRLIVDDGQPAAGLAIADLLGIKVLRETVVDAGTEALVAARLAALNGKDFAEADRIRAELAGQGVQLMDYKDAETGERRTRWEVKR
ncbi:cysteine--tRNA ligase [Youhaiella tibetensis]|uniref:Cysteine--tRNA ligase n=1 Tax=Paradevosia tibetensis TaxID=1447062 RepID=A0A5B9DL82_9HYPH|nr:cysteine--tRNA ligase [Youhaiella tibetensis]QEE19917.1 cysteine--tRNA ligase [Youhaiella tibetensis]GGF28720.1 cysteine--tRNA ligase [Youhaiella tibetensis]